MDMEQCHSELQDCNGKAKFFRLPGLLWLIAIPFGLVLLTVSYDTPTLFAQYDLFASHTANVIM